MEMYQVWTSNSFGSDEASSFSQAGSKRLLSEKSVKSLQEPHDGPSQSSTFVGASC